MSLEKVTMPCYHPLKAYRSETVNPSGKRSIVFSDSKAYEGARVTLACGQCVGCRLERSRQWAIRCVHEASLYPNNAFITLTYSPQFLPPYASLLVSDFQKFMKRLRKKFSPQKIRFFHCGEYGEQSQRPHYHACLFNFDFPDKILWKECNDQKLYTSAILSELWPFGLSSVGSVTFESAAYVARYIMKKVTGSRAEAHYEALDPRTGEYVQRKPEYTTMSRRPGIGKAWFEKWSRDVFPHDFVVVNGRQVRPPKFYTSQYELADPEGYLEVKEARQISAEKNPAENNSSRLRVKEKIKLSRITQLKRSLDNDT